MSKNSPLAEKVVARHCPDTAAMPFMTAVSTRFDGIECHISRSGYTGEDGYEISVKSVRVRAIARSSLRRASCSDVSSNSIRNQ